MRTAGGRPDAKPGPGPGRDLREEAAREAGPGAAGTARAGHGGDRRAARTRPAGGEGVARVGAGGAAEGRGTEAGEGELRVGVRRAGSG